MSFLYKSKGEADFFDVHNSYVVITDSYKTVTGTALNVGFENKITKNVPSCGEYWVSYDFYTSGTHREGDSCFWNIVSLNENSSSRPATALIGGSDNNYFVFGSSSINGHPGINHVYIHFSTIDGTAELWLNGIYINKVTYSWLKGLKVTTIAFSCTGWGSNYPQRANALSNFTISDEKIDENGLWYNPVLSSNGNWGVDDFAVRCSSGVTDPHNAFDSSCGSYMNRINNGQYLDIFIKEPVSLTTAIFLSNDSDPPSDAVIQSSSDGVTYTDIASFKCSGNTPTVVPLKTGRSSYYRILSKHAAGGANRDFSNINLIGKTRTLTLVSDSFDASRFVKYTGRTAEYDTKIHKVLSVSCFLDTDRTIRKAIPVSIDYDTNRRVDYKYAQRLNGGDYVYNTGVRINDGKKHRIILRATGTKLELFCDGKKLPVEIPQGRGVCDSTTYLGAFPDGNSHTQFNLYGLQVFKRSLTDDELKKIPSDSLARFDKFDSDTKDRTSIPWTIYDESGNKNNMSLYWSFTKDFNPRVNVKDDYDTCVRSTVGVSSDSDLSRALYTDRLNVSDDYVAIRRMVSYEYVNNDALRKTSRGFSYEFSSIRRLAIPAIKEFDSLRTTNNDHFTWQRKDFSTERELSSIPTSSYAVCECDGIDLDDVYTIIPYLDLHGTCRAQMRYGSDSYGEWEDYTAKKIDCRYIQFRILVNGYCNAAELKIVAPIQEETQVIDVKASGTDVTFDNLYFKTPSIFPSYTGGTIEIKNITRYGCTVYLKNEDGAYIDGQVSLMIRG